MAALHGDNDEENKTLPGAPNSTTSCRVGDRRVRLCYFMDWLGEELGFKEMEDWYRISKKDITQKGGVSLLNKYGCSPSKLVLCKICKK